MFTSHYALGVASLRKSKFGKLFAILMLIEAFAILVGWGDLSAYAVIGMFILKIFM